MEHVMERHYDFDLTYITERIISVFFLPDLEEQRYSRNLKEVAAMLKSKHQDKFLVSHRNGKNTIINALKFTRVHTKCYLVYNVQKTHMCDLVMCHCVLQLLNLSEKRHDITRLNPKVPECLQITHRATGT